MIIRCICLLSVLLLLSSAPKASRADEEEDRLKEILARVRSGVASIESYSNSSLKSGTGFLCRNSRIVITNYHVIQNSQNVFATLPGEDTVQCDLIDGRPDLDLAALWLKRPVGGAHYVFSLPEDPKEKPDVLDKILVVGNPRGLSLTPLVGRFSGSRELPESLKQSGLRVSVFQLQVPAAGGQSGAPVINLSEETVGVFFAGEGRGEFELNYAIPHAYVTELSLGRNPRPFSNLPNIPNINSSFLGTGIHYHSNPNNLTRPTVGGPGVAVNVGSKHWGYAPRNPEFIFRHHVDDQVRFAKLAPRNLLAQIVRRKNVLIVSNATFGYRILVPEGYVISERFVDNRYFESLVSFRGLSGGVRIIAVPVPPPANLAELHSVLNAHVGFFVNTVLGAKIVPPLAPLIHPNQVRIDPNPVFTDPVPRVNARTRDIRLWQHYISPTGFSHLVAYRVRGNTFLTVDITFPTGTLGTSAPLPERFVEDMFIVNSLVRLF